MKKNKEELEVMNEGFEQLEAELEEEQQFAHISFSASDILATYPTHFTSLEDASLWLEDIEDEIREAMMLAGLDVIDSLIPEPPL